MHNHTSIYSAHLQRGFTLVELLLVILVLSSLALATTYLVDGINEQSRFDDTKTRLQLIRQAIVGDTSRTLNGQAEISGYLADMGRFPANIQELIERGDQPEWDLIAFPDHDISPVVTFSMGAGWRGPYINTLPESDGKRRLRDGWGNGDLLDVNFGWAYSANELSGVTVQSLGANGISEVTAETVFDADYPASGVNLIEPNDYMVSLDGITVQLNKPISIAPSEALVLRIYYISNDVDNNPVPLSAESQSISSDDSLGLQTLSFPFSGVAYLGSHVAVLLCDTSMVIFDGNCNGISDTNNSPYPFKLIPRAQLPVIPWNIQ